MGVVFATYKDDVDVNVSYFGGQGGVGSARSCCLKFLLLMMMVMMMVEWR